LRGERVTQHYDTPQEAAVGLQQRARHKPLLLLTDFDGTVSDFVDDPNAAAITPRAAAALDACARLPGTTVGVVTGRRIADVQRRLPPGPEYVAGLHGLEIEGPDVTFQHPDLAMAAPVVRLLAETAERELSWCPGLRLENKTYALTCHVRGTPAGLAKQALQQFAALAKPSVDGGALRLLGAAEALEARPAADWDKGRALDWLRAHVAARIRAVPIVAYVGDDRTDEDAFLRLGPDDVGIGVGSATREVRLDWRLPTPGATGEFLEAFARLRQQDADTRP
jgi:trehalose 6-phosphate phosphatase